MNPALAQGIAQAFAEPHFPAGLAKMEADFAAHRGPDGISDLGDWLRRRAAYMHPAFGIEDFNRRKLPGPQKQGIGAAEIDTARGHDGRWYARYGYWLGEGGGCTPITHSPPHASEQEAVAWAVEQIRDRIGRRQTGTDSAAQWARKIEAWCVDQLGPQQLGLL